MTDFLLASLTAFLFATFVENAAIQKYNDDIRYNLSVIKNAARNLSDSDHLVTLIIIKQISKNELFL